MKHGTIVVDSELDSTDQDEMVVVNTPGLPISEWYGSHGRVIADDNPSYPEDEEVIVTVYCDQFREKYDCCYTGGWPLHVGDLDRQNISRYSFPKSRLSTVSGPSQEPVPIGKLLPNPFHVNTYGSEEDMGMVERLTDRESVFGKILVRPHTDTDYYTIINGHKRIWAASALDFGAVSVDILPLSDLEAARQFARWHLGDPEKHDDVYTGSLRQKSAQRIKDMLPDQYHAIFEYLDADPDEALVASESQSKQLHDPEPTEG